MQVLYYYDDDFFIIFSREWHRAVHTEMRSNSKDNIKAANKHKAKRFIDKFL